MNLNIAEKFLLLCFKPEKSGYVVSFTMLNAGMVGAILLDLAMDEKINIEGNMLITKGSRTDLSAVHHQILKKMADAWKPKKIRAWVSKFSHQGKKWRHPMMNVMQDKRLVKMEDKKFLVFPYKKAILTGTKERRDLAKHLHDIVTHSREIGDETASLLGLIHACGMHRVISKDRSELKQIRKKLKDILRNEPIAQGVDKVIRETQAAVNAAIVSSVVLTSTGSG